MDEHVPVLVDEVLEALAPSAGDFYVDGTFGRGGHTERLLQAVGSAGGVLALDRDPAAIAAGRVRYAHEPRVEIVHAEFAQLRDVVHAHARGRAVRGVLLDLGVSSPQLDEAGRGFSFVRDGPLDMRRDPGAGGADAREILRRATGRELADLFFRYGEERFSRRIARALVARRREEPWGSSATSKA